MPHSALSMARNRSSSGWVFPTSRVGLYARPTGRKSPSRGRGSEWPPLLTLQGPPYRKAVAPGSLGCGLGEPPLAAPRRAPYEGKDLVQKFGAPAPRERSASPLCAVCEILVYATLRYANMEAEGRDRVPNQNGLDEPVSTGHKPRPASGALPAAKLSQTLTVRSRNPSTGRGSVAPAVLYSSNPALGGLREKL